MIRHMLSRARKFVSLKSRRSHQVMNSTSFDRYPEIFRHLQAKYGRDSALRILSFGCSTGEECFSLRTYFPNAQITGVDIEPANLKEAASKNTDANIHFLKSTEKNISLHGPYDLTFAMSVLCRWPGTRDHPNVSKIYPFAKYEQMLDQLCRHVVPGGALTIFNSNYRFTDSKLAGGYALEKVPLEKSVEFVQQFDRNGDRLPENAQEYFVFIRRTS